MICIVNQPLPRGRRSFPRPSPAIMYSNFSFSPLTRSFSHFFSPPRMQMWILDFILHQSALLLSSRCRLSLDALAFISDVILSMITLLLLWAIYHRDRRVSMSALTYAGVKTGGRLGRKGQFSVASARACPSSSVHRPPLIQIQ